MRISDWSSDVCSSDLAGQPRQIPDHRQPRPFSMGRDIDRKGHIRSGGGGGVPVDALYAVMAAVGGNRLDHAGSAILRAACALGPRVARSTDDDAAYAHALCHTVKSLVAFCPPNHRG